MDWRLLALLCFAPALGSCGNGGTAPAGPQIEVANHQSNQPQPPPDTRDLSAEFRFPVLSAWVERSGLQARGSAPQQLAATWIHEGDPIAQATAYRRALEAAGYRLEPGRLTGNSQIAFTGSATISGQRYRFAIDFVREAGGDQRVALVFTPCRGPKPSPARAGDAGSPQVSWGAPAK